MPLPPPADLPPRAGRLLRLGIVVATIVGLARAAQAALSPLLAPTGEPGRIVVRTVQGATLAADSGPGTLWIRHLVVDGRLYRAESVEVSGGWRPSAMIEAEFPLGLRYDGADSGAVSFHGGHALMVVNPGAWRGTLRVARDGRETQSIELPARTGVRWRVLVEDPVIPESPVLFLGALILVGAAAWRGAPVTPGRSGASWLLLSLTALHLLFWLSQAVGTTNDSPGYLASGHQLLREGAPAYFPPGYPVFLSVVEFLAGSNLGAAVTLLQHGMSVAAAFWIYRLLQRIAGDELALIGGLLAGGLPPMLAMSQTVMSEIPALFAMIGSLYYAVRSAETGSARFALLSGLLAGWAGTLRVVPLVGLLPAIALLHFADRAPRRRRQLAIVAGTAAAVLLLPVAWFWARSGEPRLANSAGLHLYNRVVDEQGLLDETAPATRELLSRLGGDDPRELPHWVVREHPGMKAVGYRDAEELLGRVSMEGIRRYPLEYLAWTPALALRELGAEPSGTVWAETVTAHERLESPMPLALHAGALRWRWRTEAVFRTAWPILCWAALAGLLVTLFTPQRGMAAALAIVPAGYLLATASLDHFIARHSVVAVPFVISLALMVPASLLSLARRPRTALEPAR